MTRKFIFFSLGALVVGCTSPGAGSPSYRHPSSAATVDLKGKSLKNLWVYQVSDFETNAVNRILEAKGINNITAQAVIVDPVTDVWGSVEATLVMLRDGLAKLDIAVGANIEYATREVNYYTKDGHAKIASCYLLMYQKPGVNDKVVLLSGMCGSWPGIEAVPNGAKIKYELAGAVTFDDHLNITGVKPIDGHSMVLPTLDAF